MFLVQGLGLDVDCRAEAYVLWPRLTIWMNLKSGAMPRIQLCIKLLHFEEGICASAWLFNVVVF